MTPARRITAAQAEAQGTTIPFDFNGETYEVLPTTEWPWSAMAAFEDGKVATFVRLVLAGDSHDRFLATNPTVSDGAALVEAMQAAMGIAGN